MNAQLLYIDVPPTVPEPAVQTTNGQRIVITSIRICAPTNNNGTYELHHVWKAELAASTSNALAYNVSVNSKTTVEFLTHPIVLSPGESLWISGSNVTVAVYGIIL